MTPGRTACRRAFEVDLAGFLAEPHRPEFAPFRDHYPRCPECAAEVRAWTDLHLRLGTAGGDPHPAPALLLDFEDRPAALPLERRRAVEGHLVGCSSCRDELAALRAMDPAAAVSRARVAAVALEAPEADAGPAQKPQPSAVARWLGAVRAVVLHPAFAYGLVLLLLYPAARAVLDTPDAARAPSAPVAGAPPTAPPPVPAARSSEWAAAPAPPAAPPAAAERGARVAQRAAPERRRETAAHPAPQADLEEQAPADAAPAREMAAERSEAPRRLAPPAGAGAGRADLGPAPGAVLLSEDEETEVARATLAGPLTVRLPLPPPLRRPGEVEVRVADAGGRREVRERVGVAAGQGALDLRLPAEWLEPGTYRVTLAPSATAASLDAPGAALSSRSAPAAAPGAAAPASAPPAGGRAVQFTFTVR